jgi:poly-gamma-glutamate capsule biosynthesis protein CapA/YwtB (metallophosphatase superfamily)
LRLIEEINFMMNMKKSISIAATGDISFMGRHSDEPALELFSDVIPIFEESDMVIGNLESPLLLEGRPAPDKACLRGHPQWAGILKKAGIHIVALANNHIMDYGEEGLRATRDSLERCAIHYVGAGRNLAEANAPLFLESSGRRIAVLARSSVEVKSRCYAQKDAPGAAFLDIDETCGSIARCRQQAELVILVVHWGMEDYNYPSPRQRALARRFFEAGARIVIGHHPHVVQGLERVGSGIVAYSLGNFLFDEFDWQPQSPDGASKSIPVRMNSENRNGMILQLKIDDGELLAMKRIFTRIDADGRIAVDSDKGRIGPDKKKSKRLKAPLYGYFWKLHSIEREWRIRLNKQIQVGKILANPHKIRPRHIIDLIRVLKKSARITSGRSTNPYD